MQTNDDDILKDEPEDENDPEEIGEQPEGDVPIENTITSGPKKGQAPDNMP